MKINHKPPPDNKEIRKRDNFLWFPKTIDYQTRWLERAKWKEIYTWTGDRYVWKILEWVDENEEKI